MTVLYRAACSAWLKTCSAGGRDVGEDDRLTPAGALGVAQRLQAELSVVALHILGGCDVARRARVAALQLVGRQIGDVALHPVAQLSVDRLGHGDGRGARQQERRQAGDEDALEHGEVSSISMRRS